MARNGRRRERLSLAVALLVHGAAVLGLRAWVHLQAPVSAVAARSVDAQDTVEIDVSDVLPGAGVAPPVPEPGAPGVEAPASAAEHLGKARSKASRATAPDESAAAPFEEPVAVAELETEADPPAATAPSREGPIDLGIGPDGWQRWVGVLPREAPAPRTEPRARPVVRAPPVSRTGGLQEGLEKHDQKLGLGPAGRVATALFQAAHTPDAPETGTALFNVTVLRTGAVEVSLSDMSDKRWQSVATHAAEALRQAPPRIPPPREGYRLTLKITAEETMPNGLRRKDLHGARIEATPPALHDVKAAEREVELKNPTTGRPAGIVGSPFVMDLPGVYVAGTGKVCSYRIGISALGPLLQGGCDLSNAGAKLQRMVRTEVREQTAF